MIEITALVTGLVSWLLLLYCIFKHKQFSSLKIAKIQTASLMLCSISLYMPSLSQKLEYNSGDHAAVIDCVTAFHLASLILLLVVIALNVILFGLTRKQRHLSD